jgi:hypothetical protein
MESGTSSSGRAAQLTRAFADVFGMTKHEAWARLKNGGLIALIAGPINATQVNLKFVLPLVLILLPLSRGLGLSYVARLGVLVAVATVAAAGMGLYIRGERRRAASAGVPPTGIASPPRSS